MSAARTILKRRPRVIAELRDVPPTPRKRTARLTRQIDALPLDLFRISVGALLFLYFLNTFFEASDLSAPNGLIDHRITQQIFWFTKIGLFQTQMDQWMFQAIYLLGCLCCGALVVGYRVKLFAFIAYVIAVCTYRWNFLVMYVDDSVMHLLLFWMLLMPVGHTLVLSEWWRDRSATWERWKERKVPGITVKCFFWNLALIYIVAGAWKWTSPMWRSGDALYVILKLPISLTPDFWKPEHMGVVRLFNYGALVLEPLFPLIFILPKRNLVKYLLLIALLGFHAGTIATLQIPFANIACIAAMILPFGGGMMDRIRSRSGVTIPTFVPGRVGFSGGFAIVFVTVLTLAMVSSAVLPRWRMPTRHEFKDKVATAPHRAEGLGTLQAGFFSSLWMIGIAQQYQLFNWIDERNFHPHYEVLEFQDENVVREIDQSELFPTSTRGVLLQFYLQGITWMKVPPEHEVELRRSLHHRLAARFCRNVGTSGTIEVNETMERIVPGHEWKPTPFRPFMKFRCDGGRPEMLFMNLNP
jgi:hypothetical protein